MPLSLITPARIFTIHHTGNHSDANKITTGNFKPEVWAIASFKIFSNVIFTRKLVVKLEILLLSLPTATSKITEKQIY